MNNLNWISDPQIKIEKGVIKAIQEYTTVCILTPHDGIGFIWTLLNTRQKFTSLKYVTLELTRGISQTDTIVQLVSSACNLKFKKFKICHIPLFTVYGQVREMIRGHLHTKRIVFVFRSIENLNTEFKLQRFMYFLSLFDFKCGIILECDKSYLQKIAKWKDKSLVNKFMLLISNRIYIPENQEKDIIMVLRAHGCTDLALMKRIAERTKNFKIALDLLKKERAFKFDSQLRLFEDNNVRH